MTQASNETVSADVAPRRWKHRAWRVLRTLVIGYLGALILIYFIQKTLIFPGSSSQGSNGARVIPSRDESLVDLSLSDGAIAKALFGPMRKIFATTRPESVPTVIYFYGNGDHLSNLQDIHMWFRKQGCHALFPEYPGYGISGGSAGEAQFYDLADKLHAYLESPDAKRKGIDPANVIVVGQSIGSGPACYFAQKYPTKKLILLSPFTSLTETAKRQLPFLPVSLLLRHHFDNATRWPTIAAPTLIISGTNDSVIPHDMSVQLKQLAPDRVTLVSVNGADHNDLFDHPDVVLGAIQKFVQSK